MCLFSLHNLITDPPFSRLDLVSCRNLLIYLESELQKKIIALFHYALRPGGFLFLGPSEMVGGQPELFRTVDKKHRIFQSRGHRRPRRRSASPWASGRRLRLRSRRRSCTRRAGAPRSSEVARTFERVLLESYAPACVVVNERGDIVYFSPRTGRYLEPPAGTPTVNVLDMARKGLRLDLRTALHKAVNSRVPVVARERRLRAGRPDAAGQRRSCGRCRSWARTRACSWSSSRRSCRRRERRADGRGRGAMRRRRPASSAALEAELRATKDHLQATAGGARELERGAGLLQRGAPLDERGAAVGQRGAADLEGGAAVGQRGAGDGQRRAEEEARRAATAPTATSRTSSRAPSIATVFLDRELRIKKFTPAAIEVFRLIDSDAGRPIADIAPASRRRPGGRHPRGAAHARHPASARCARGRGRPGTSCGSCPTARSTT